VRRKRVPGVVSTAVGTLIQGAAISGQSSDTRGSDVVYGMDLTAGAALIQGAVTSGQSDHPVEMAGVSVSPLQSDIEMSLSSYVVDAIEAAFEIAPPKPVLCERTIFLVDSAADGVLMSGGPPSSGVDCRVPLVLIDVKMPSVVWRRVACDYCHLSAAR
jgi:hypothetical protein